MKIANIKRPVDCVIIFANGKTTHFDNLANGEGETEGATLGNVADMLGTIEGIECMDGVIFEVDGA